MLSPAQFRELVSGRKKGAWPTLCRAMLACGEPAYAAGMFCRNLAYDWGWAKVYRVNRPVISVGNLTMGGSGKTPLIEYLARWYRDHGVRVSIVSRGYGAGERGLNDEAMELEEKLPDVPHVQDVDRFAAATIAVEELDTELILLDDAMQHRRLHRDLEIVVIDCTEPFGYGRLFPRGALREPLSSLERADLIVLTRCNLASEEQKAHIRGKLRRYGEGAGWVESSHVPIALRDYSGNETSLDMLQGRGVAAFCGIGNPQAFRESLLRLGCRIHDFKEYPDHHNYSREDIADLGNFVRASGADLAVTTHKDMVKIGTPLLGPAQLLALRVGLQIESGQDALDAHLNTLLAMVRDQAAERVPIQTLPTDGVENSHSADGGLQTSVVESSIP